VTELTLGQTICVPGWIASITPDVEYTGRLKVQGISDYGYKDQSFADYQEDALVPLQLGGDPRDERNLWPQTVSAASTKDVEEDSLNRQVCAGSTTLEAAQHVLLADWGP
jgi:hypothetical protein